MITLKYRIKDAPMQRQRNVWQRMPGIAHQSMRRDLRFLVRQLEDDIQTEPPKPKAGIMDLMTARQIIAYWASNGFGRGIPTKRTGNILKAWKVEYAIRDFFASITLKNRRADTVFVMGERRQPFHRKTGWRTGRGVFDKHKPKINRRIAATWHTLNDPKAGIP